MLKYFSKPKYKIEFMGFTAIFYKTLILVKISSAGLVNFEQNVDVDIWPQKKIKMVAHSELVNLGLYF